MGTSYGGYTGRFLNIDLTTQEQQNEDQMSRVPLERMLPAYYSVRGMDAGGLPKRRTLERLDIVV